MSVNSLSRILSVRHALHTDANDITSTPFTLYPLQITDVGASMFPRERTSIPRNVRTTDGRRIAPVLGAQDVANVSLATEWKGANSNTGGAVSDWEAKLEQGYLLKSLFGAAAAATSSAATTVDSSGHTPASGVLGSVDGTNITVGQVIAFGSSSGLQVGRVASKATNAITLQHPYAGTPTTGATIYRLGVYTQDDDLTAHIPVMISAEADNWRRDYFGCHVESLELAVPNSGKVDATWSLVPSTWADVAAADPSFAAPTAGSPMVNDGVRLYLANTLRHVRDVKVMIESGVVTREVASAPNGRLGAAHAGGDGKRIVIEGSFYLDTDGAPYGLTGATTTLGAILHDDESAGDTVSETEISLTIGSEIGAVAHVCLVTCALSGKVVDAGGFHVVQFRAESTGTGPHIMAVG